MHYVLYLVQIAVRLYAGAWHNAETMAMRLKVKDYAQKVGIKNARQLRDKTGLGMASCYKIWNEEAKGLTLDTLNTLCNVLQVGPAFLLEWTPDVIQSDSGPAPGEKSQAERRPGAIKRKKSASVGLGAVV
jgi:DNA-binding Xre family transcriptional regulator